MTRFLQTTQLHLLSAVVNI